MDRLPPHSPEAEQGVLGCVIQEPDLFNDCIGVTPLWFYDLRHQHLWDTITELAGAGQKWDLVSLVTRLRDVGRLSGIGDMPYIMKLTEGVPSTANLPTYLEILAQKWRLRRMASVCMSAVSAMHEGGSADEVIAKAQAGILEVTDQSGRERESSMRELVPGVIDILERFAQGSKVMSGYSTGFNYLDNMMAGWERGQMYVIAGRPSTGKTSLAVDIMLNFAKLHGPVAFFSLEMTKMQVAMRALANLARQDFQTFRNGFIKDGDAPRMIEAAGRLAQAGVFIDETSGLNGQQMLMRTRRMMRQHGVKMVVIDYLSLMGSVEKYREKRDRVADASDWCKRIAKALDIPVVVLAQLNREMEKGGKSRPPQLSDLAESGDIEQDADFVGTLWRPRIDDDVLNPKQTSVAHARDRYRHMGEESKREWFWLKHVNAGADAEDEPLADHVSFVNLAVLKQRNGPTGDVGFVFYKRQMRFADAAKG